MAYGLSRLDSISTNTDGFQCIGGQLMSCLSLVCHAACANFDSVHVYGIGQQGDTLQLRDDLQAGFHVWMVNSQSGHFHALWQQSNTRMERVPTRERSLRNSLSDSSSACSTAMYH